MRWGKLRRRHETAEAEDPLSRQTSVLGPGITVYGSVEASGHLHLHGDVVGDVRADIVVLEADGFVEGDIFSQEAHIHGQLLGRVTAPVVAIEATAVIRGSVLHHKMSMAPGAYLDGFAPWRPMNYFTDLTQQRQRDSDEHVYERG